MFNSQTCVTRRAFVQGALAGAVAFPYLATAKNALGRVTLALIGAGTQGRGLLHQFLGQDVVVTAICDCDKARREDRTRVVNEYYAKNPQLGVPKDVCRAVADFHDVLSDPSIDLVVIATPDHWHAYLAAEAMKAGKDVYCEKPLTHTVNEAKALMAVAEKTGRILQTGAMQRSSIEFRTACEIVRNGGIGEVKFVDAVFGGPSQPPRDFENPGNAAHEGAPNPEVDFDMWCGPAPRVKYSDRLAPRGVHTHFPGFWRDHDYFGMGGVGDFGAHQLDIAQWGLGMDASGPVKVVKSNEPVPGDARFGGRRQSGLSYVFANGAVVRHVPYRRMRWTTVFYGTEGVVAVDRDQFAVWRGKGVTPEDALRARLDAGDAGGAERVAFWLHQGPNPGANDKSLLDAVSKATKAFGLKKAPVKLYKSLNHPADFVAACAARRQPCSNIQVGARSAILCNLANLSYVHDTGFDWDPVQNVFANGTGKAEWLDGFYAPRNGLVVRA